MESSDTRTQTMSRRPVAAAMIGTELPGIPAYEMHTLDGFPQLFTSYLIENLKLNTYFTAGAYTLGAGGMPAVPYRSKLAETLYIEMTIKFTDKFRAEFNQKADRSRGRPPPFSRSGMNPTEKEKRDLYRTHFHWVKNHNPALPDIPNLVWALRKAVFGPCDCLTVMEVSHFAPGGELRIENVYPRDIEDIELLVPPKQRPMPLALTATMMGLGERILAYGNVKCRITFTEEFVLKYKPDNPQYGRWGRLKASDLSPNGMFWITGVQIAHGNGGIEKISIAPVHPIFETRGLGFDFYIRGNDVESLVIDTSTPILDS